MVSSHSLQDGASLCVAAPCRELKTYRESRLHRSFWFAGEERSVSPGVPLGTVQRERLRESGDTALSSGPRFCEFLRRPG